MKKMISSYHRPRGDVSGAAYCGRVDVFYAAETQTDPWCRVGVRQETYWTPYGDGDTSRLAAEIAAKVGGEVRSEFFDPYANGGRGYLWQSDYSQAIVVVGSRQRMRLVMPSAPSRADT